MQPVVQPIAEKSTSAPRSRRWLILVVVAIAQLMVTLDGTVVNIALPAAQQALKFPDSGRQWIVTAYALAFGCLLLAGGRIGDMFSRKWVFSTGLAGFAVFSAIGGAANSFPMLVTARTLQGAFGAILAPVALGTLLSTFRDPRERAKAVGIFGSVAAAGGALGLIVGGLLTQYLSWRYTLYVNLVFAAVALAGALTYLPSTRPASRPRMDWPGAILGAAGLSAVVIGLSHAARAGWASATTAGCLGLALALLSGFVLVERRSSQALLPLRVVLDRTRGGAYVALGIAGMTIFGGILFLTYYLQLVKAYTPVTVGLLFLPFIGCVVFGANLCSLVTLHRLGPRVLIASGMLLSAAAFAYLGQLTVTSSYAAAVLPSLLIMGAGFGMIIAPAINAATAGVATRDSGVASALVNVMQQVGASIGTAALSTVALSATAHYLAGHHDGEPASASAATYGYNVAFLVSAVVLALGTPVIILLIPSRRRLAEIRTAAAKSGPRPLLGHPLPATSEPR